MTQYTVKYDLTEKEEEALRELLPCYQQYIAKDGSRPFEKYTLADVFQSLMYIPKALMLGDVSDVEKITKNFLTFAIDPICQRIGSHAER